MIDLTSLNRNQKLFFGVVGAVVVVLAGVGLYAGGKTPVTIIRQPFTLEVWGTNEREEDLKPIFESFEKAYENKYQRKMTVKYTAWEPERYEDVLVNKLAEKKGPNLAIMKGTWLLKHHSKIQPLPFNNGQGFGGFIPRTSAVDIGLWTPTEFQKVFVPVANDFIINDRIFGVPLWVDTIGLYYNQDTFRQAGIAPSRPAPTWQGIEEQVPRLRVSDYGNGAGLRRAAIALGTVGDIRVRAPRTGETSPTIYDNGVELVSLFVLQHGGSYCSSLCLRTTFGPNAMAGVQDFMHFSLVGDDRYTWSPTYVRDLEEDGVRDSVDAFVEGKVAMILGTTDLYDELTRRVKESDVSLKVAAIPQYADEDGEVTRKITYGTAWGLVSIPSVRTDGFAPDLNTAALELEMYIGRQEMQYSHVKTSKRPSPRQDLIDASAKAIPELADVYRSILVAGSLQVYDEKVVAQAITEAIDGAAAADPTTQMAQPGEIIRHISEALGKVIEDPARTPPPAKPSAPPGVK